MWKKILVVAASGTIQQHKGKMWVAREFNPGHLASATSALTTELRQPSTSKTFLGFFTFYLCFSLDPFKWESFNLVFMKGQDLIIR